MLIRLALVLVCLGGTFAQVGLVWAEGKMYWAACRGLQRSDLDGSNIEDIITGLRRPNRVALDAAGGKMYWTHGCGGIQRANLDGSNFEDLVTGFSVTEGIALDVAGGKMYWTDRNAAKIQRANLDGSDVEDLVSGLGGPGALALDVAAGKMYWTDTITDKIQRANLDGSDIEDLATGLDRPGGLALDVAGGEMYWTELDVFPNKLRRAKLDGSNVEDLNAVGILIFINSLELDIAEGKIYWADGATRKIQRANLNGSNIEDLITSIGRPDGLTLDIAGGKMYWTDAGVFPNKIQRANLDGSNVEDLVIGLSRPFGFAFDTPGGKIYWADGSTNKLQRANLDGSNIEDLLTDNNSPAVVALDIVGGKIYWTNAASGNIQRANLDGSSIEELLTGLSNPLSIALDVAEGKMYWTNANSDTIQRANLDGSNVENLVTTGLGHRPRYVALDVAEGKMYWTSSGSSNIQRANLDGSNIEELVASLSLLESLALDVAEGKMYWTHGPPFFDKIQRANLDGSNIEEILTDIHSLSYLALDVPLSSPSLDHYLCYRTQESRGKLCADEAPNEGAVCTSDADCGDVDGVCVRNRFAPGLQVDLTDEIEAKQFDVQKPVALCNPADKNGEGISDADTHLKSYQIRQSAGQARHIGQTDIHLENQFHPLVSELFLDTVQPDRLLVPTAKDLNASVDEPDPANHNVNHFKCYRANISQGKDAFPRGVTAHVGDQFNQPTLYALLRPRRLCLPVDKNGEGIKDAEARLVCYQVRPVTKVCGDGATNVGDACRNETDCGGTQGQTTLCQRQARHERQFAISVNNQFGPERLDTVREEELCVPSVEVTP